MLKISLTAKFADKLGAVVTHRQFRYQNQHFLAVGKNLFDKSKKIFQALQQRLVFGLMSGNVAIISVFDMLKGLWPSNCQPLRFRSSNAASKK